MILGLRTVIYRVELTSSQAKVWYRQAFEVEPYFDQPFYVGFNVGGFELGLDPDLSEGHARTRRVRSPTGASRSIERGLRPVRRAWGLSPSVPVKEVGGGIKVAIRRRSCSATLIGLIENPHFTAGRGWIDSQIDGLRLQKTDLLI